MKFNKVLFAQEGAAMPAPEEQGAPMGPEEGAQAGGNIEEQVMAMAQQIAQQIGDPQIIMMLADALMQLAQGAAQQQAPAFQKNGGRVVKRIR